MERSKWVAKNWGGEKIIVNNDKYCGKILYFIKGFKCSLHMHKLKTESMYIHNKGKVEILFYDYNEDAEEQLKRLGKEQFYNLLDKVVLEPGDSFHIPPGRYHQIVALEDTELFEFSTPDDPSDSYRIIKGD